MCRFAPEAVRFHGFLAGPVSGRFIESRTIASAVRCSRILDSHIFIGRFCRCLLLVRAHEGVSPIQSLRCLFGMLPLLLVAASSSQWPRGFISNLELVAVNWLFMAALHLLVIGLALVYRPFPNGLFPLSCSQCVCYSSHFKAGFGGLFHPVKVA